jgi:hypothetical protein
MRRVVVLGFGLVGLVATPAWADEQYFGYTYSAELLGKGQTEAEFWATDRRGKDNGHFDAQDYRVELEHGVTDRFSVSAYANFAGHHIRNDEERIDRDFALRGLSAEFKYQLLSPYKDGFGLTLYAEPAWSRIHGGGEKGTELELEFKALVQKNRVANGWYAGAEGRYASVYPDWTNGLHRETYAVFAGPVVHYGGKNWWATLSYQPQLFGSPSPGGGRALDEYEKRELRLKVGYNF